MGGAILGFFHQATPIGKKKRTFFGIGVNGTNAPCHHLNVGQMPVNVESVHAHIGAVQRVCWCSVCSMFMSPLQFWVVLAFGWTTECTTQNLRVQWSQPSVLALGIPLSWGVELCRPAHGPILAMLKNLCVLAKCSRLCTSCVHLTHVVWSLETKEIHETFECLTSNNLCCSNT